MKTNPLTFLKNLTFGLKDSQRCQCSQTDIPLKKNMYEKSGWPNGFLKTNNTINRLTPDGRNEELAKKPDWINSGTGSSYFGKHHVYVSTTRDCLTSGRNIAQLKKSKRCFQKKPMRFDSLPDLPEAVYEPGVVSTDFHIYVIGGWRYLDGKLCISRTVNCLCLKKMSWKTCDPLLQAVAKPVTLLHDGQILILGSNSDGEETKSCQTYSIKTSQWTTGKQLPFSVDKNDAQAIVFKEKLRLVSLEFIVTYEPTSDEWVLNKFESLESPIGVITMNGKLCAMTGKMGLYVKKVYDEENNQWN